MLLLLSSPPSFLAPIIGLGFILIGELLQELVDDDEIHVEDEGVGMEMLMEAIEAAARFGAFEGAIGVF